MINSCYVAFGPAGRFRTMEMGVPCATVVVAAAVVTVVLFSVTVVFFSVSVGKGFMLGEDAERPQ